MSSLARGHIPLPGLSTLLSELQMTDSKMLVTAESKNAIDPQESKISVINAMKTSYESMDELSKAVVCPILSKRNDLQNKINFFLEEYSYHIAWVKKFSWNELKDDLGDKMMLPLEGIDGSLEDFRGKANSLVDQLTIAIGKEVGLSEAEWIAVGTKGYSSDVDITLKMVYKPPHIEEVVLYKTLRDCMHFYVFGGLSGDQLDTESYMPHPAEIDLAQYLSPTAQPIFQTGEKASVLLQRFLSLHNHPDQYTLSKQMDLNSISNPEERKALEMLHDQIEIMMQILGCKICEKLQEKVLKYKEARELAFVPLRIQLGERCSEIQGKIEQEFKKMDALTKQGYSHDEGMNVKTELDNLHLELQSILMIIAILQAEGTISVAEGKATILEEGGQVHAGTLRKRKDSMSEFLHGSSRVLDELAKYPKFRRKASLPLTATLGSPTGKSDEYAKIILGKDVEKILQPFFPVPTAQTFVIAAYEESMQLQHVIVDGLNNHETPGAVAIKGGKYALRVTRNLYRALLELKSEPISPRGLNKLCTQAEKLERMSASLEKCKRRESINTDAATILLTEAILAGLSFRGNADELLIKTKVENMFKSFDFGGIHFGRVLPKEEHFHILSETLEKAKELFINVDNPKIVEILQSHAGFNRFHPDYQHLNTIHQCAADITLKGLKLTEEVQVRQFLSDILELSLEVKNMALEYGLLTLSTPLMTSFFDFPKIIISIRKAKVRIT